MVGDLIAAGAAVLAATIVVLWPTIQATHRRYRFRRLIIRELQELQPFPGARGTGGDWRSLNRREFIHRAVLEDPHGHLEFILSLDPMMVYQLRQLWGAFAEGDTEEWLRRLSRLATYDHSGEIERNVARWKEALGEYATSRTP